MTTGLSVASSGLGDSFSRLDSLGFWCGFDHGVRVPLGFVYPTLIPSIYLVSMFNGADSSETPRLQVPRLSLSLKLYPCVQMSLSLKFVLGSRSLASAIRCQPSNAGMGLKIYPRGQVRTGGFYLIFVDYRGSGAII